MHLVQNAEFDWLLWQPNGYIGKNMEIKRLKCILKLFSFFKAVYSDEQLWPMGPLFIKTSPIEQYSYVNDFSVVFNAFIKVFLFSIVAEIKILMRFGIFLHDMQLMQNFENKYFDWWENYCHISGSYSYSNYWNIFPLHCISYSILFKDNSFEECIFVPINFATGNIHP